MFKLAFAALTSAILLLVPSFSQAQENNAQLTGTVAYRERITLPSDAVVDVQLLDTSVADVAAQTVAEVLINAEGRQVPVPFTLTYDPAKIVPGNRYSVRATIRSGDGMLMFSSTQAYPVLTHGAPSKANLILHTVGHGAKPGAAANKQTAPAPIESAAPASQSAPPVASQSAPVTTAAPPSSEPSPSAMTPSSPEPEKRPAQADEKAAQTKTAAEPPSAVPPATSASVATPTESAPSQAAPPTGESPGQAPAPQNVPPAQETVPPAPAATEQQASPAQPPLAAAPGSPSAQSESKPVEARPTAEQTGSPESKTEPTTPTPEAKGTEPEAPLPEAPSESKRGELAAAAPSTAPEPEPESTSRPERPAPNKALTPLADTQWKLIQLGSADVVITPPQKPVTLAFSPEGKRIAGSAGCNSYLGTFTDDHGRLHLSPGNMTMMACIDPASSRERKFIAMLRSADGYRISGGFLLLTSNGKTVAKFQNNQ